MVQRVAIAGFGAIGKVVAAHLDCGIEGMQLAAVSARDPARAEAAMAGFARPVPVLPLSQLGDVADIVVECEAARGFPANVNVAAALALAGIGPDRTMIDIWADPGVDRNLHKIEVEADSVRFTLEIANVPSVENPRTGRLTPLSVVALLRKLS